MFHDLGERCTPELARLSKIPIANRILLEGLAESVTKTLGTEVAAKMVAGVHKNIQDAQIAVVKLVALN